MKVHKIAFCVYYVHLKEHGRNSTEQSIALSSVLLNRATECIQTIANAYCPSEDILNYV